MPRKTNRSTRKYITKETEREKIIYHGLTYEELMFLVEIDIDITNTMVIDRDNGKTTILVGNEIYYIAF